MAGGVGSRFWPVSTQAFPKQFHDLLGSGQTLLQQTFNRLQKSVPANQILIATNQKYKEFVLQQLPKITEKQLVLEPNMRNTAPCILYAAHKIANQNPNALMIITPSDHIIEDETSFTKAIETSFYACGKENLLMTLGIKPTAPNTGFGYIQFPKNSSAEIKKVQQFREKPNLETAKRFISEGNYLWNAGIFIWSAKSILTAFEKHLPKMSQLFAEGNHCWNTDFEDDFIKNQYPKAENISIDFGILEKANNVAVLPVSFHWNDLGTWGSLFEKLPKDKYNNATVGGSVLFKDAHNNMVHTQSKKQIIIEGLNDYIVVEKENVLLIYPKDKEQEIKALTKEASTFFGKDIL